MSRNELVSLKDGLEILRQNTVAKQDPFAALLSCANSRVPVELVFDQILGHLFVTRIAGNICTPEIVASFEYGAAALGIPRSSCCWVKGCGTVKGAMAGYPALGQISALYTPLQPVVERAGHDLATTAKTNAQMEADLLWTASPVLSEMVSLGRLTIVAAYYGLSDGSVTLLG